ncbi:hypothetical protein [Emticicia sp. 17c]|uniref:hypothetical protein n=1 Tax=Emticicia sp. 17c TaxID=3127704 RepID=UPI00301BE09F
MNNKKFLLVFLYFLTACTSNKTQQIETNKQTGVEQLKNEDFDSFLKRFCSEKDFQHNRTRFPLVSKYYDVDAEEPTIKVFQKEEDEFSDLNKKEFIKKVTKENPKKCILNIQIDGTGIYVDYIFELINGQWFLTTTIDQST